MTRKCYLAGLAALQIAAAWQGVPVVARWLKEQTALGTAPDGWPAALQAVLAAMAVLGFAWMLAFPSLALLRHHQQGVPRFLALPSSGVVVMLAGTLAFALAVLARGAASWLPIDPGAPLAQAWAPLLPAGLALMVAGSLSAEILRHPAAPITLRLRARERSRTLRPDYTARAA